MRGVTAAPDTVADGRICDRESIPNRVPKRWQPSTRAMKRAVDKNVSSSREFVGVWEAAGASGDDYRRRRVAMAILEPHLDEAVVREMHHIGLSYGRAALSLQHFGSGSSW
ncbi:hypothetical protein AXG93_2891s1410 [Marchantia polymorpha subsp. ruderalis]|uniref:Uncharacterized protein n=1 Tax=Marchantia polymorpha subsp. ruderalis TaxID=1480154 RepID=A0A176WPE0_MARPO|nr:hypothetical protein AXG93_2891s1410 [Marchantia polymorpha subsp. ruderalis]